MIELKFIQKVSNIISFINFLGFSYIPLSFTISINLLLDKHSIICGIIIKFKILKKIKGIKKLIKKLNTKYILENFDRIRRGKKFNIMLFTSIGLYF